MDSANLDNRSSRGRVFMGNDASMELGASISLAVDGGSTRYKKTDRGRIDKYIRTSPLIGFKLRKS